MGTSKRRSARFGEADLESEHFGGREPPRPSYPPDEPSDARSACGPASSEVFTLIAARGPSSTHCVPDTIEAALVAAIEQLPRAPTTPELPAWAYRRPR
jgi:hypothetical protein